MYSQDSLYGLLPRVNHFMYSKIVGAFKGPRTMLTDVVPLIWKIGQRTWIAFYLLDFFWKSQTLWGKYLYCLLLLLTTNHCGAWHDARAAPGDETFAHISVHCTQSSFLASAGTSHGAEIQTVQHLTNLNQKHALDQAWANYGLNAGRLAF